MLAKLTSKNQLTLPKSVTDRLGPVQYFEVQLQAGQVVLTPVRIQRSDAVRAKLAALALDDSAIEQALAWGQGEAPMRVVPAKKKAKPAPSNSSTSSTRGASKTAKPERPSTTGKRRSAA